MEFILSTAIIIFLVMDPLGNMPFFISTLSGVPLPRHRKIIFREALIALAALTVFLLCGKYMLKIFHISQGSIGIAGGVVLFLIALKMIFSSDKAPEKENREPFIVPLAIPMLAGPSSLATIILVQGAPDATLPYCAAAMFIAWLPATIILVFSSTIAELIGGNRILEAGQSLMGLLLTAISIEMLVKGIKLSFM